MPTNDWIPTKEADLIPFLDNFRSKVADVGTSYGLTEANVTTITNAINDYSAKRAAADSALLASKNATISKDDAKKTVSELVRQYGQFMQKHPNMEDAVRSDLGLRIPDRTPTKRVPPTSVPVLKVDFSQRGKHTISATDSATPFSKAKPASADGFDLWLKVADVQPADNSSMEYIGRVTAGKHTLSFEESQYGKQAYYVACWVTKTGERGNTGDFTNATISK